MVSITKSLPATPGTKIHYNPPPPPYEITFVAVCDAGYPPYLCSNTDEIIDLEIMPVSVPQVAQQAPVGDEFCDDVDRFLLRADGVQLNEVLMFKCLHNRRLKKEGLCAHAACFQGLNGHISPSAPFT